MVARMKRINHKFATAIGLLTGFALWTVAICFVDVRTIGPLGSAVGFAGFNQFVHRLTGVHWRLYDLTDWLGLVPVFVCIGFGLVGVVQWIQRKSLRNVDRDLLVLGGFYIVVILAYLFFEVVQINYRPVLINDCLETSYPSSTTLLVMCVMPTLVFRIKDRMDNRVLKKAISLLIMGFTAAMVIGRLVSGVHWCTDIVGGALLSAGLVIMYDAVRGALCKEKN
jgi:undecaprenyl-diphosphatase